MPTRAIRVCWSILQVIAKLKYTTLEGVASFFLGQSNLYCFSNILTLLPKMLILKEYAQAEGVSAGFGVDLELRSDLSLGI
jgi:hypothetical protein